MEPFGLQAPLPRPEAVNYRFMNASTANRLLTHVQLDREPPTLDYLHRLIREHQLRVPFETLTKLIDYEPGLRRGDFLPPIEEYVERIVTRGAGGLCWTLARGFQALLAELGFDASFLYMDSGHACVRVDLPEGPFYADVGYSAPIFQAYPLFESFTLHSPRETFEYIVRDQGIDVLREPGPKKRLDPNPRRIEDLRAFIEGANDWGIPDSFLYRLHYSRYVDGNYVGIRNGVLHRFLPSGLEKTDLAPEDIPVALADIFHADPSLYTEAMSIQQRYQKS